MKIINIIDPTYSKNNLGKSISRANVHRIVSTLAHNNKKVKGIYAKVETMEKGEAASYLMQELLKMFKYTFESTSVHPCVSA